MSATNQFHNPTPAPRPLADLHYLTGEPPVSAQLKRHCADFRVDEELGFALSGAGEHLYLQVRKTDLTTTQAARYLSERTGVALRDVGYSGMKDRRGETSQWFSLRLPSGEEPNLGQLENGNFTVLASQRNHRKLRVGSHRRNHFALLLRDCRGPRAEFERRLEALATKGLPNYFGAQRFGREMSNIHQVADLFARGEGPPGGRQRRGMLFSAARAYLFNQVLSARLADGSWSTYREGDVLNLDDTDRCFTVAPGAWDDTLTQRLQAFDIHLTGPLAGQASATDKYTSRGEAADMEESVLAEFDALRGGLRAHGLQAGRRPLRCRVGDLHWQWLDEKPATPAAGDTLALRFVLPRGAYATSLLREVCLAEETPDATQTAEQGNINSVEANGPQ